MKRPREITAAAVVALAGSALFVLAGLVLAASVTITILAFKQKYPGVSMHSSDPDFNQIEDLISAGVVIPVVLGAIGLFTGSGLLRMKAWARKSAIVWSICSTLVCLAGLAYPGSRSGIHFSATAILLLMLFLVPINAWWLLLFYRPETRELFAPAGTRIVERRDWLKGNAFSKLLIVCAVTVLIAVSAGWMAERNSPMREIERSRDAVTGVTSWHYHSVRLFPGRAPETIDADFLCPSFEHRIGSIVNEKGETETRETIHYFENYYTLVGDRWLAGQKRPGQVDPGIFECSSDVGPLGGDEYSLPYAGVIKDGSAKHGEMKEVDGESCREYEITVDTPHDLKEKEFRYSLCINEQDHLPRATRRMLPVLNQEGVSHYGKWNAMKEPDLPAEIVK